MGFAEAFKPTAVFFRWSTPWGRLHAVGQRRRGFPRRRWRKGRRRFLAVVRQDIETGRPAPYN
jgi:hypothetical protein